MSACCCHIPPAAMMKLAASAQFKMPMPVISAKLTALAALTVSTDVERADLKIALIAPRLPKITMAVSGPMLQISAMLKLGNFSFTDPIKLAAEMAVMANSLNSSVTPGMSAALKMNIAPLMQLSLVAKLMVQLKVAGMDPLSANFAAQAGAFAVKKSFLPKVGFALSAPQLKNIKLLVALPLLVQACEALKIDIGDPAAAAKFSAKLSAMASLSPPALSLKISLMLKIAAIVAAVDAIVLAFGADAFSPAGMARISMMLKVVASLNIALPIPPIDLGKLAALPPFEDIKMGETIAGSNKMNLALMGLKPPAIPISAFISMSVALKASLGAAVKVPPLAFCTNCGM